MTTHAHRDDSRDQEHPRGLRLSSALLAVPLIAAMLIAVIRGSRHFSWDWPTHAHHHLLANIATAVGLAIVALLVLIGPLQRGEPWSWWGLAVTGLALFGGYWLGNVTVGLGIDPLVPNVAQSVLTLSFLVGLVLAWRELDPEDSERVASASSHGRSSSI